jgi:hypothetical protein
MAVREGLMTWAGTGSDQQFSQSVRDRQRSAEMAAKPKQETESEKLSEIYFQEHQHRVAKQAAEEQRLIAEGRIKIL